MTSIQFADEPNQEERIAKLRAELEKLGGSTTTLESMPADMEEEFLRHVLEYETAEPISLLRLLENSGLEVPAPETLDKDTLTRQTQRGHRANGIARRLPPAHRSSFRSRALRLSLS